MQQKRPGHLADLEPPRGQQFLGAAPGGAAVTAEARSRCLPEAPGVPAVSPPRRQPGSQILVAAEHAPVHQPLGKLAGRVNDEGTVARGADPVHPALAPVTVVDAR